MSTTQIETRRGSETVIGWIDPQRLYTKEGIARAIGLKEHAISIGRRARKLKQYEAHGRVFYLGRDVIEWLTEGHKVSGNTDNTAKTAKE